MGGEVDDWDGVYDKKPSFEGLVLADIVNQFISCVYGSELLANQM